MLNLFCIFVKCMELFSCKNYVESVEICASPLKWQISSTRTQEWKWCEYKYDLLVIVEYTQVWETVREALQWCERLRVVMQPGSPTLLWVGNLTSGDAAIWSSSSKNLRSHVLIWILEPRMWEMGFQQIFIPSQISNSNSLIGKGWALVLFLCPVFVCVFIEAGMQKRRPIMVHQEVQVHHPLHSNSLPSYHPDPPFASRYLSSLTWCPSTNLQQLFQKSDTREVSSGNYSFWDSFKPAGAQTGNLQGKQSERLNEMFLLEDDCLKKWWYCPAFPLSLAAKCKPLSKSPQKIKDGRNPTWQLWHCKEC